MDGMKPNRKLKPCGTVAAARRHQRAGEPLCDPCADAMREYRERGRERPAVAPESPVTARAGVPDELTDTRANYDAVVRAMETAPASAIASLSKQRVELHKALLRLEEEDRRKRALNRQEHVSDSFDTMMRDAGITL